MDNLFNILIGLIILYSLVSPFLKKKKGQQLPPYQTPQDTYESEENSSAEYETSSEYQDSSKKTDGYDILSEIENLFKKPEAKTSDDYTVIREERKSTPVSSENTKDYSEHIPTERFKYTPVKQTYKKTVPHHERIDNLLPAIDYVKIFERKPGEFESRESPKTTELRKALFTPNEVRKAFLLSEILGKPIAYRQ